MYTQIFMYMCCMEVGIRGGLKRVFKVKMRKYLGKSVRVFFFFFEIKAESDSIIFRMLWKQRLKVNKLVQCKRTHLNVQIFSIFGSTKAILKATQRLAYRRYTNFYFTKLTQPK